MGEGSTLLKGRRNCGSFIADGVSQKLQLPEIREAVPELIGQREGPWPIGGGHCRACPVTARLSEAW